MTSPLQGGIINPGGGTLSVGTNNLQTSIDTLTNAINRLITSGSFSSSGGGSTTRQASPQGGGSFFPPVVNPFSPPNQPGMGGGGSGGSGNVQAPQPFNQRTLAGFGAIVGAFNMYGQQQMPTQLALDQYVRQSQLGMTTNGGWSTNQLRMQAFGTNNTNLNALASNPMDAIAMTQQLQFLGGSPLYGMSQMGRAGYGAAASFGMTNSALSGSQMAALAQQMYNPVLSQRMIAMGYGLSPRALGGGPPQQMGAIMQSILRGWYDKNSVAPGTLYRTLSEGGRGYANLQALGLNPTQIAPVLQGYNQLFNAGYTPNQATRLFTQAGYKNPAGDAARATLNNLGVSTANSDIQALKNAQSVLTGRAADVANGFNSGLKTAASLLTGFNEALSAVMKNLRLDYPIGYAGGFGGVISGTNHGAGLLGAAGIGILLSRLLGGGAALGGAGGALGGLGGALGGIGGGLGGAVGGAGAVAGAVGPAALLLGGLFGLSQIGVGATQKDLRTSGFFRGRYGPMGGIGKYASGGMSTDTIPAMLSPGEAVLNPGATRALGTWNIHNLNNRYRPPGAGTSYNNGVLMAAGGVAPVWPFANKNPSQYRRVDQGWDLQYPGNTPTSIFAVESGTLRTAGPDPNGFGVSYPLLQLDHPVDGARYIYYGHTMPDMSKVGQHVARGASIGHTGGAHSGGNAYSDPNWLEIGFWNNGPTGNGAAMKRFLLGAGPGGGSPSVGSTSGPGPALSGIGGSITSSGGAVSGVGFSEASLIPNISEISSLSSGGSSGIMGGVLGAIFGGSSIGTAGSNTVGRSSAPGGTPAKNMAIGKQLATGYGWSTGIQWQDLVSLWNRESGWRNDVWNGGSTAATRPAGSSGAYGIAQSLPYTKYPKAGWPPGYGGTANAGAQIGWGLGYIKGRYGDPSKAWQHENSFGWYGAGGRTNSGISIVGDRGPEIMVGGGGSTVIDNAQTMSILKAISAEPAQTPWKSSITPSSHANNVPPIQVNFDQGSIVIKSVSGYSDVSHAGSEVAKEIVNRLSEERTLRKIAEGEKM